MKPRRTPAPHQLAHGTLELENSARPFAPEKRLHSVLLAPDPSKAPAWAEIARACADDVGLELTVEVPRRIPRSAKPALTLHLPVEFAVSQHPAWCLACRLACFCPSLRVSVLVRSEFSFPTTPCAERASA